MLKDLTKRCDVAEWQFVLKKVEACKLHLWDGITAPVLSDKVWNYVATYIAVHQGDQLPAHSHIPAAEIHKRAGLWKRFQETCYRSHVRSNYTRIVASIAG
jgi:hypothetical protein